jgi:hypothetical protein
MKDSRTVKKLHDEYFNGRQSVEYRGVFEIKGEKIKIHIDVDSYDFQSSAKAYIYNAEEKKWNVLTSIPYSQSKAINNVFYQRKVDESGSGLNFQEKSAFKTDIDTLFKRVKDILDH